MSLAKFFKPYPCGIIFCSSIDLLGNTFGDEQVIAQFRKKEAVLYFWQLFVKSIIRCNASADKDKLQC